MLDLVRPQTSPQTIVEHLRTVGATEIRAATDHVWIVGHAPSGALVELYWWPNHGYSVSRRLPSSEPDSTSGVFPAWETAVTCALQA